MAKFNCKRCGFETEAGIKPKNCPYCGARGSLEVAKNAAELLKDLEAE